MLQAKIEEHVKYFTANSIDYHTRETIPSIYLHRLDEMLYSERKLSLAQQRLASLLLELTTESIDRLDSSVKTLDSNVGSLSNLTRKLVKSSKTLEYLTSILTIMAMATISVDLLKLNPYYAVIAGLAAVIVWIIVLIRARREPKI